MRSLIIIAFSLVTQSSFIYASDLNIDAQIEKIRQAPESLRYQLVNELKRQIAQMNANEQARAIAQYQEETLNAQQTDSIDNSNIANQANQEVIKNQLQQEQEHQLIVPPIETIKDSTDSAMDKILPDQNPTNPLPQDNQPNYSDPKNNIPDVINGDTTQSNPIKNPVEDVRDDVKEQIQNPIDNIRDDIQTPIQNPVENIKDNIQEEIEQPEIVKEIPKRTKPSIPTTPSNGRF
jgi:gas vesicle protein